MAAKADTLMRTRQYQAAERVIDELAARRSDDSDVWYIAAEIRGLAGNILGVHLARAEYFMLAGDLDQAGQQLELAKKRAGDNFVMSSRITARQEDLARKREVIKSF